MTTLYIAKLKDYVKHLFSLILHTYVVFSFLFYFHQGNEKSEVGVNWGMIGIVSYTICLHLMGNRKLILQPGHVWLLFTKMSNRGYVVINMIYGVVFFNFYIIYSYSTHYVILYSYVSDQPCFWGVIFIGSPCYTHVMYVLSPFLDTDLWFFTLDIPSDWWLLPHISHFSIVCVCCVIILLIVVFLFHMQVLMLTICDHLH